MHAKRQYAALRDPESGVFNRVASVASLIDLTESARTLGKRTRRRLDLAQHRCVDAAADAAVWAVTNLTLQRPEYFFVRPNGSGELPEKVSHALQLTLGRTPSSREATPDLLHSAIFASAALPLVFDPVLIPNPDGAINEYCDGGVASNSPVGIAHAVSKGADVMLLDPPFEPDTGYADAVEIAFGVSARCSERFWKTKCATRTFRRPASARSAPRAAGRVARATQDNPDSQSSCNRFPSPNCDTSDPKRSFR